MDEYGPMGYAFGILWVVWTKTLVDAGFFGEQQRDLSLCRKAGIRQTQFHSTETQKPKSFIIQITLLRVIPTVTLFCQVSDISSESIYGIYFLTFYSGILSGILFWHSLLAVYLTFILTSYLASFLASILTFSLAFLLIFYLASILTFFLASILAFFFWTFHSGSLFGIYSDFLFWHPI